MKISKSFKVKIDPTEEQKKLMKETFGCVRFIYNYGLNKKNEHYKATKKPLRECMEELYSWIYQQIKGEPFRK